MATTKYIRETTVQTKISGIGYANQVSTALSGDSARNTRGVILRRFVGGVMYNKANSTQALTPLLEVTNGTTTFQLDRTTIQIGDSATWMEAEYAVDLDTDQYIKVTVAESLASSDDLFIFLRFKDMFS